MLIALARPVMNQEEKEFKQEITPIVVVLDISKSMLAQDISPNRLQMAKYKLLELMKQSKESALAVVLFAKSAFILSPLTQDFTSLKYLLNNFDETKNFDSGSNIIASLEASNKLLKNYKNKNILLLSDGGHQKEFKKEIEYANKNNLKIYTLALASKTPCPIKINDEYLLDQNDNIVTVSLNENIKELSLQTEGGYITYTTNHSDISAIYQDIISTSLKDELKSKKIKVYTELFYYPLALALLILLFAFSSLPSRKTLLLLSLLIFSSKDNLNASLLDFKTIEDANTQYNNKEYENAAASFNKLSKSNEKHYNYANSLYKNKQYKEALKEYNKIKTSNKNLEYKKQHNIGNTQVKLNDLQNAISSYEKALEIKEDKQTKENLQSVKKYLKKQDNKDNKNKKDKNKKDKKDENKKDKKQDQNKKNDKQKSKNKDSKKDKKNKKEESENKQGQKNKQEKNKDSKKNKEDQKQKSQESSKIKQTQEKNQMSDLEQKKWLKKIQNQKSSILLRKHDSKSEDNSSSPW